MTQDIYAVLDKERNLTTNLRDYKKLCMIIAVKSLRISVKAAVEFFGYSISSYHRIKKRADRCGSESKQKSRLGWQTQSLHVS